MGKKEKAELGLIGVVTVLILCLVLFGRKEESALYFERPQSGTKQYKLFLTVGEQEQARLFRVEEKEKTEQEIEQLFLETREQVISLLNPTNSNPVYLTSSIELPARDERTGAVFRWESSDETVLDRKGNLSRGSLLEETTVTLMLQTSIGEECREEWFEFIVEPFRPEEKEGQFFHAEEYLKELEQSTRSEEKVTIPMQIGEVEVREERKGTWKGILALLFFVPGAIVLLRQKERQKQREIIEQELMADYPRLVTKLTLYVGAGLSLRSAWERIAAEYRQRLQGGAKRRIAFDEVLTMVGALHNGTSEGTAYECFGRKLGLRPYLRCTSLMISQLQKGTGGMREKLEYEVKQAWEEHRKQAEHKTEEAQTKLLFPMMGMLFLVFIIVMVPAFFSMGL